MKVVFIDTVHPILWERLSEKRFDCVDATCLKSSELNELLFEAEGLVIRSKFLITKEIIEASPKLRFVARSGSGLENIDVEYATQKGIRIFNSPEGNRDAVAEHALGMLLALNNHLVRCDAEVRQGMWNREANRGFEIKGKTIGLVGYGVMGNAFAQRLNGFDCTVLAYDKYKENYSNAYAQEADMQRIFNESDIVSLHLPLTDETRYLANTAWFNQFKKPIVFVNTARGKIVDTEALLSAINSGLVKGACLDVLEYESTSFENLRESDLPESFVALKNNSRVLLSPHVAGWTVESYEKLSRFLADKILAEFEV
jgi:D-3-phosphoglycerate dehydrogenase / 2-oxoglutarate reductase